MQQNGKKIPTMQEIQPKASIRAVLHNQRKQNFYGVILNTSKKSKFISLQQRGPEVKKKVDRRPYLLTCGWRPKKPTQVMNSIITSGKMGFHSFHLSRTKFDPRLKAPSVPVHLKMWARGH
jgi:hypothetical protein